MLKQHRRQERLISPVRRAAMAWRSHRSVANILKNTWREFGGVGWPGCGVVDIVRVRGGRRQLIAKTKSGLRQAGIT